MSQNSNVSEDSEIERFKRSLAPGVSLRPHQVDGLKFMLSCRTKSHGCILADEMGLGKTCQAVAALDCLGDGPHLILCPLSVVEHWTVELNRFGGSRLKVVVYRGTKEERAEIRDQKLASKDWTVLLTTYELFLKDTDLLKNDWTSLTVDEAHRLKNSNSLLYQALNEQSFKWTLLLTGTPVQNNLRELYSLLSITSSSDFPIENADHFVEQYSDATNSNSMAKLRKILDQYMLRRTKDVVCADLPEKSEVTLFHGISALQQRLYKAILVKNHESFEQTQTSSEGSRQSLMNTLVQLRKCVDHPYLFDGVEPEPFKEGEHLIEASGKLLVLDALLTQLRRDGHKVLIFSQMTRMLDILQDYLTYRGVTYERLDGSVRGEERFAAVKQFNADTDTFAFLLSTKAGGLGLTLTGADTVIFYDSDFNPQNDIQAAARAHRIGQNKPVKIVRLVAKHTVEEIIINRAARKLKLTHAVMGKEGQNNEEKMTAAEITEMLTYGLRQLTTGENPEPQLSEQKITQILGQTSTDGAWLPLENVNQSVQSGLTDDASIYYFEGKDYKEEAQIADKQAMEKLVKDTVETQAQNGASQRRDRKGTQFLSLPARTVKVLTPEQQEERRKKRQETMEKRKQKEQEEQQRKEQARFEKLQKLWKDNGYKSSNLPEPKEAETEEEEIELLDDDDSVRREPFYVIGDVAHPTPKQEHSKGDTLVLHCVDNSGYWGRGGVFDALSGRSTNPENSYKTCGRMKDLSLGDAHLIEIDDLQSREHGRDYAVLLVAMDKKDRTHVDTSALETALQRVAAYVVQNEARHCSVHLPRIGYGLPKVNWYTIERLIKKHLSQRRIPTYIYYFSRKRKQATTDGGEASAPKRKMGVSVGSVPLTSLFEGLVMCLCGFEEQQATAIRRLVVAFDGQLQDDINARDVTHFVVGAADQLNENQKQKIAQTKAAVVKKQWLDACFKENKMLPISDYAFTIE